MASCSEPAPGQMGSERAALHTPPPVPAPLVSLTNVQLDEAELQVRLVLNQLNADSSERLEIIRKASGVEVQGIVPTEERKRELQAGLQSLAHVYPSISSFAEVQDRADAASEITSVKSASIVAQQPGPLEAYLVAHGKSRDESERLSQRLFYSAVTAQQETNAIKAVRERFHSGETLSEQGAATLHQLLDRHQEKLLAALEEEDRVLAETGITITPPPPSTFAPGSGVNAANAAETNLSLCKELTSGGDAAVRPAELLVTQIAETVAQLRGFVLKVIPPDSSDPNSKP